MLTSYLKQAEYVGHHDGDGAGGGADDAHHPLRFGDDWRSTAQTFDVCAVLLDQSLHEGERLLQGVSVPGTGVQDTCPQSDVRQQIIVIVDTVKGKEHGLQSVYTLLLLQLPTRLAIMAPGVYWEEPTQGDIPVDADGVQMRVSRPFGFGSLSGLEGAVEKQQQQQRRNQADSLTAGPIRSTRRGLEHDHSLSTHPHRTTKPSNQKTIKARYYFMMARGLIAIPLEAAGTEKASSHVSPLSQAFN